MASTNVGKWSVTAGVDAGAFGTGVNAMTRDTARMERSVKKGFTGMEQAVDGALGGVGASISLFGMRVGFQSLSMASVVNTIKQTWQGLGETLDKEIDLAFLADQLGTTIEFLSTLRTVAGENSVEATQFSAGMERLNQQLGQARMGSAEALAPFTRLGITIDQIQGQDFQATFMQIARGLENIPDRAVRARTAMELFGRGGAGGMLRFVQGLDSSIADVQARGGFTTQTDLDRFQEMNTAIDRMSTTWDNLWRGFLSTTAPLVSRVMEGWRLILFETRPIDRDVLGLPPVMTEQDTTFALVQLARRYRDTGDASLLDIERLQQAGYRVPEQFNLGGGLIDAHAVLRDLDPISSQAAAGVERVNTGLERFTSEMSRIDALVRERDASFTEAARIMESTRTPQEQFEARLQRLISLFNQGFFGGQGAVGVENFTRAMRQAMDTLATGGERRLPGALTFGSAAAATQVNQTQAQIRDRMDTLIGVSRETRDALRDILRANPEVQGILQGGA